METGRLAAGSSIATVGVEVTTAVDLSGQFANRLVTSGMQAILDFAVDLRCLSRDSAQATSC
jgi:hypothetical protein